MSKKEDFDLNATPRGELAIRTQAMPADTNPNGDIFGGWVLSHMDIAGGIVSCKRAKGRCVTVAVESMKFHRPVRVGDILCCYVEILNVGTTSIKTHIEAYITQFNAETRIKVTEGTFIYVAIDDAGRPIPVTKDASS